MALLEDGMRDEVDIDFADADIMDVRNDENEEENLSLADVGAVADDAGFGVAVASVASADADATAATAKFFSFCFDTKK